MQLDLASADRPDPPDVLPGADATSGHSWILGGRRRTGDGDDPQPPVHRFLLTGEGAALVLLIMFVGSLVLWGATPLLWLWVGSQVQGLTGSLGLAFAVMLVGVLIWLGAVAAVLVELSEVYRANQRARRRDDPGHAVLERVLVISAGIALAVFGVWFFFLAGANPVPIGIQI